MIKYFFYTINLITILVLLNNCHGLYVYDVRVEGNPSKPTFLISEDESSEILNIEVYSYPDGAKYWNIYGQEKLYKIVYGEVPNNFRVFTTAKKLKPYILYVFSVDDGEDAYGAGYFYIKKVKNGYILVNLSLKGADIPNSQIDEKLLYVAEKLEIIREREKRRKR